MKSFDLNLLRCLHVIIEEGSVTKAAQRLGVTQPAVSNMLVRLRENFDDPMLVRTRRGVTPTTRALELAQPLRRILAEIDTLCQPDDFSPAMAEFSVGIAATDYALRVVLLPLIERLATLAPAVRVAIHPLDDERLYEQLEKGDFELGLIVPEICAPDLRSRTLYHEDYVCAVRREHPLAKQEITLDSFCDADHLLVSYKGGGFYGVTDKELARHGRSRRVVLSVPNFLAVADILNGTDLLVVVPSRLLAQQDNIATFPPPAPLVLPGFDKIVAWHPRTETDVRFRWLRTVLYDVAREYLPRR